MPFDFLFRKKQKKSQKNSEPEVMVMERIHPLQNGDFLNNGLNELLADGRTLVPLQTFIPTTTTSSNAVAIRSQENTKQFVPTTNHIIPITGDLKMKVTFTDPMTSGCMVVQVAPTKTATECIQALKSNGLLGLGNFNLVANGKVLSPDQSLADGGVTEGGTVAIQKNETGA